LRILVYIVGDIIKRRDGGSGRWVSYFNNLNIAGMS
jgi:hypothetical protein